MPGQFPNPDAVCDGGDLDCGSGLLLIIRNAFEPVGPGGVLEVRSRESSVKEDLPAWCRMVGHTLLGSEDHDNRYTHYFLEKKGSADDSLAHHMDEARDYRWRVRVRWTEGMSATAYARNHSVAIGQPASFDTEDPAPSAIEHLLSALGGCLAVGYQWRLSREGIDVYNLEVTLEAQIDNILVFLGVEDAGHPGIGSITGRVFIDADDDSGRLAELWQETVTRSPVAQTLLRKIPCEIELKVV